MNKTMTVFKYELKAALKSKAFLISNLIFMGIIIIGALFIRFGIGENFKDVDLQDRIISEISSEDRNVGVVIKSDILNKESIEKIYPNEKIVIFNSDEELRKAVTNEEVNAGIIFENENYITLLYEKAPTFSSSGNEYIELYKDYLVDQKLKSRDITLAEIEEIESSIELNSKVESIVEDNRIVIRFLSTILSVLLYLLIIMNGQIAAMNVAREKNDRTMELLITSTNPKNLINGKVLASFFQSMTTLLLLIMATGVALFINKELFLQFLSIANFSIDFTFIGIFLIFFVIGYIMYLYVYAALGATVSTTEEVNTAMGPLMIIVVAVYFGAIMALSNPDPNNLLLKIMSFISFSSMFTIHARYALTDMPLFEVGISLGILIVTTIILSLISIRIYRSASLNYGNRNKITNRIKRIFKRK